MAAISEEIELLLISGKVFEQDLPKDKLYLLKYFRTKLQEDFIRYYLTVGNHDNFAVHSGHRVSDRWRFALAARLKKLEEAREKARSEMDIETLAIIETGKYRISDGKRLWQRN